MHTIFFATTNKGKVNSLQKRLAPIGIEVVQVQLELIEPQEDTCQEISESKAKQAFKQLDRPLLVDDSAFHIPALNGFPGPYVKYVLKTLGGRGILQTAKEISDRHAYFESSLTYISGENEYTTFSGKSTEGRLSDEFVHANNPAAWSEAWNIFIPNGSSKVLAHLTNEEIKEIKEQTNQLDTYTLFTSWLKERRFEL